MVLQAALPPPLFSLSQSWCENRDLGHLGTANEVQNGAVEGTGEQFVPVKYAFGTMGSLKLKPTAISPLGDWQNGRTQNCLSPSFGAGVIPEVFSTSGAQQALGLWGLGC